MLEFFAREPVSAAEEAWSPFKNDVDAEADLPAPVEELDELELESIDDGDEITLSVVEEGNVFGEMALTGQSLGQRLSGHTLDHRLRREEGARAAPVPGRLCPLSERHEQPRGNRSSFGGIARQ